MKHKFNSLIAIVLAGLLAGPVAARAESFDDMFQALKIDDTQMVGQLLRRGFSPDTADPDGYTLLMVAAREGSRNSWPLLLDAGARLNARNRYGETALMLAALNGRRELVAALLARGVPPDTSGWTALIYAAMAGHVEIARMLLLHGAAIDAVSPNGTSALMLASREGHVGMVRLLLARGANPSLVNEQGYSAIRWAAETGNSDIAELLLEAGAER